MSNLDYSQGKIYKLTNSVDDEIYIGSTVQSLVSRLGMHRNAAALKGNVRVYAHLNGVGWNNVSIELIEAFVCDCKEDLERREGFWQRQLKPSLNTNMAGRTRAEYNRDNIDYLRAVRKAYHTAHPAFYASSAKGDRETCECGAVIAHGDRARHLSSKIHAAWASEQGKQAMADTIDCGCGRQYSRRHASRHVDSKTHQRWLAGEVDTMERFRCPCGGQYTKANWSTHSKRKMHIAWKEKNPTTPAEPVKVLNTAAPAPTAPADHELAPVAEPTTASTVAELDAYLEDILGQ